MRSKNTLAPQPNMPSMMISGITDQAISIQMIARSGVPYSSGERRRKRTARYRIAPAISSEKMAEIPSPKK